MEGHLKGFDKLDNLVLDNCLEFLRGKGACSLLFVAIALTVRLDPEDQYRVTENTRPLGLVVCRGTQISMISPTDGTEEIANPFADDAEEEEILVQDA